MRWKKPTSIFPRLVAADFVRRAGADRGAAFALRRLAQILDAVDGLRRWPPFVADVALIDAGADRPKKLEAAANEADQRYGAAAGKLSAARTKSADKLNKAVNAELAPLKLERAGFMTQVETDAQSPGPQGIDRVEFWVQPIRHQAGAADEGRVRRRAVAVPAGAQGGAVRPRFGAHAGVRRNRYRRRRCGGGRSARLARLAGQVQVMAVTHAPQVAARANQHLLISKDALDKGKRVATRVNALAADHRREEIARMLAGAEITARARAGRIAFARQRRKDTERLGAMVGSYESSALQRKALWPPSTKDWEDAHLQ